MSNFSVLQRSDLPSDHAPLTVTVSSTGIDLDGLAERASSLGGHAAVLGNAGKKNLLRKPIAFNRIDRNMFQVKLDQVVTDFNVSDISECEKNMIMAIYNCIQNSVITPGHSVQQYDVTLGRWERLLNDKDDSRVWRAVNWKGEIDVNNPRDMCPSDEEFRIHLEAVLNPDVETVSGVSQMATNVSIPVLDGPILPDQVEQQIKKMKPDKACGPDGLPPGVFSLLPVQWILTLSVLFNNVFLYGVYPIS